MMDQLTRCAVAARREGLTYGKYMGLRYEREQQEQRRLEAERLAKKRLREQKAEEERRAAEAAKTDQEVTQQALENAQTAQGQRPVRTCAHCGKPLPGHDKRRRYCTARCADMARAEIQQKYRETHRVSSRKLDPFM